MDIVSVTKENLDKEHICCTLSGNRDCQVSSKKSWLRKRFDDGLVFLKGNVRGKCFIEYLPAEKAWVPIEADGAMFINCFWVAGQFKGQGNGSLLLEKCIQDSKAKGKTGLAALSSKKKMPFLSDPDFFRHKGFFTVDTAEPFYELLYLPFDEESVQPRFCESVKAPKCKEPGFVLYYSQQCPYTAKYVPLIEEAAKAKHLPFRSVRLESAEQARHAPAPYTTYSLFYNGEFLTNEILSLKRFENILTEKGL